MSDKEFEKIKELAKKCIDESETGKDAFFAFCNKVSNKKLTIDILENMKKEIESKITPDYIGFDEYKMAMADAYNNVLTIIDKHLQEVENDG